MNKIKNFLHGISEKMKDRKRKLSGHGWKWYLLLTVMLVVLAGGLVVILRVEDSYTVLESFEKSDTSGTQYLAFGSRMLKYSADGVSCVDGKGQTVWNCTFSMQSPIADICENSAVVADQQGTSVYIFDENGQKGQFETLLPIEKVKVARQGVVAAVLTEEEVTWINFYDTTGGEIAKMRTTVKESGYPMDIALSPDGMKIMVSFLWPDQKGLKTRVAFYNFDSIGQTEENNQVNLLTYDGVVVPSVYFVDEQRAVILRNNGFSVCQGKEIPKEKGSVDFEDEILTCFHEEGKIGFIFKSDKADYKYKLKVYNLNGRCTMKKYLNMDYRKAKMMEGNILLINEKGFQVYSSRGRKRVDITYQKAVEDVTSVPGLGKYMVLSNGHTELIRVK